MTKSDIFLSYRRDGGDALACLLSERLRAREYSVFYDIESLRAGKFNSEIYDCIDSCRDFICILPEHGLDRCRDPEDWVRKEVAYAIERKKNIIPIMMRNFSFPEHLPEDIAELKNYQGITMNFDYFDAAFSKLIEMLTATTEGNMLELLAYVKDEELAQKITRLSRDIHLHNDPELIYTLARCYHEVDQPALNEEIFRLCEKAAMRGHSKAQSWLASLYEEGIGCGMDLVKAFDWQYRAAQGNDASAKKNFAQFLTRHGRDISVYWLEQASFYGDMEAMLLFIRKCDKDSPKLDVYVKKLCELGEEETLYAMVQELDKKEYYDRSSHILAVLRDAEHDAWAKKRLRSWRRRIKIFLHDIGNPFIPQS